MKRLAATTSGDYVACTPPELKSYLPSFAAPKKVSNANMTDADRNLQGLLEIIAAPLVSIVDATTTPRQLLDLIYSDDPNMKCGICYSPFCMICRGPPYACGAYCPQCNRFFHVHCCAGWAENSKETPSNVLKCPICFYLLKVPGAMFRVKKLQAALEHSFDADPNTRHKVTKLRAGDLPNWQTLSCIWCRNIFENPDSDVYQCGNADCGAYYHEECLNRCEDVHQGRCRQCDGLLRRSQDAARGISRIV
jgi:hypothetical protein